MHRPSDSALLIGAMLGRRAQRELEDNEIRSHYALVPRCAECGNAFDVSFAGPGGTFYLSGIFYCQACDEGFEHIYPERA